MVRAVLGISPGTKSLGVAVLQDGALVEWKVKTFKEPWSWSKRAAILRTIRELCECHDVTEIALKKPDPVRSSFELDKLVSDIRRQARRANIYVWQYSLSDLDLEKRPTKRELSERMVARHPKLKTAYDKERENRFDYHTKMFEAVAMAECCNDQ